jgi:predicted site-specific integrase-resolvase
MTRLLTEKQAAESIGLDVATFRNWVASGKLPKAIPDCGKFDIKALDRALDRLSGLETASNALDAWRAKGAVNARTS